MRMVAVLTILMAVAAFGQNPPQPRAPLTIQEVVRQTKSGISEEIIIANIKKAGRAFDLSTEEILELKRSGVSEAVIKVLLDPSQPYTPPQPPAKPDGSSPSASTIPSPPRKPLDPIAEKIPPEPGMYMAGDSEDEFVRLEFKTLTASRSGRASSILTGGLKKSSVIGYLVGANARTRATSPSPVFYIRLPEKASIEEVLLLQLITKDDRREIELGPDFEKPSFPPGAVKQYESQWIDLGVFRITPAPLEKGEYLFFLLGSADEKKGIAGKGYDMGLQAPLPSR